MIGERIKSLRKEKNITQVELGKAVGVSTSMIGMYETKARKPSYEVLLKIANYFDVTTDYLIGKVNYKPDLTTDELKEIGVEYIALAKKFKDKNIPPEDIEKILKIIENIKK